MEEIGAIEENRDTHIVSNERQRKRSPTLLLRWSKDFSETRNKSVWQSLTQNWLHLCYLDHSFIILSWHPTGIRNQAEEKGSKHREYLSSFLCFSDGQIELNCFVLRLTSLPPAPPEVSINNSNRACKRIHTALGLEEPPGSHWGSTASLHHRWQHADCTDVELWVGY